MRSLALRWTVSIVVGSLWGTVVAPARRPQARSTEASRAVAVDAPHYPAIAKTVTSTELASVNPMGF
jgi:hypothetical protein